jgi:integrator complex subunit 7
MAYFGTKMVTVTRLRPELRDSAWKGLITNKLQFLLYFRTFATTIYHKVSEIIKGIENPMEMKLKVIPIFQYMYHDAQTATLVRDLCIQSLPSYPACNFVLTTLHTLSELSAKSLISLPHQVRV